VTTDNVLPARPVPTPAAGIPRAVRPAPVASAPDPARRSPAGAAAGPAAAGVPPAGMAASEESMVARLRGAVDILYREMLKFGAIGALAFVVDLYVFNVLRVGVWPVTEAPLGHKTVLCKVISVSVATVVAWLGNRYWTFRHRRRATARAEFVLFGVMNVGGLLIAMACLGISHYVLDLTSPLADNVSGNGIGLVLGTLFRFWAYRQFVFTDLREETAA